MIRRLRRRLTTNPLITSYINVHYTNHILYVHYTNNILYVHYTNLNLVLKQQPVFIGIDSDRLLALNLVRKNLL